MFRTLGLLATLILPLSIASAQRQPGEAEVLRGLIAEAIKHPDDEATLNHVLQHLPKICLDNDGITNTYFLFEGDMLQTRREIQDAFRTLRNQNAGIAGPFVRSGELLVNADATGRSTIWAKGHRNLTYAVDQASFSFNPAAFQAIVADLAQATGDWVSACPNCGLSFTYRSEFNQSRDFSAVTFVARFNDAAAADMFATSFFPNEWPTKRQLVVTSSYFTTNFDHVGILRHELGHILGYRHEQLREQGVDGCAAEAGKWKPLTDDDPQSVMHSICKDGRSFTLDLTGLDIAGHKRAYQ